MQQFNGCTLVGAHSASSDAVEQKKAISFWIHMCENVFWANIKAVIRTAILKVWTLTPWIVSILLWPRCFLLGVGPRCHSYRSMEGSTSTLGSSCATLVDGVQYLDLHAAEEALLHQLQDWPSSRKHDHIVICEPFSMVCSSTCMVEISCLTSVSVALIVTSVPATSERMLTTNLNFVKRCSCPTIWTAMSRPEHHL